MYFFQTKTLISLYTCYSKIYTGKFLQLTNKNLDTKLIKTKQNNNKYSNQTLVYLLYTNYKGVEKEIRKAKLFTIASNNIKMLGVTLTNQL